MADPDAQGPVPSGRGQNESVRLTVESYVPRRGITLDQWERLGPRVRNAVLSLVPSSPDRARRDLWYLANFFAWAEGAGLTVELSTALNPDNVNRYCGLMKEGGERASTRSHLRRIGRSLTPVQWPHGNGDKRNESEGPYTDKDRALLFERAEAIQPASLRGFAIGLLAVGLGCGPSASELPKIRGDDVRKKGDAVILQVGDRSVPCRVEYEALVSERALHRRGDVLLAPRIDTQIFRVHQQWEGLPLRLRVARLRLTWLVDLLAAGVPPQAIMRAAGLRSVHSLDIALRFVSMPNDSDSRALRGSPTA